MIGFGGSYCSRQAAQQLAMESLPEELLLRVFEYLPFYTRVSVVPIVCKRWLRLAFDGLDIEVDTFRGNGSFTLSRMEYLETMLNRETALFPRKLKLSYEETCSLREQRFMYNPPLANLHVVRPSALFQHNELLEFYDNEKTLSLLKENILVSTSKMGKWRKLRFLSLENWKLSVPLFSIVLDNLDPLHLTKLVLIDMCVNVEVMKKICRLVNLQHLNLTKCSHMCDSDSGLEYLAECRLPALKEFVLNQPRSICRRIIDLSAVIEAYASQLTYLVILAVENVPGDTWEVLAMCNNLHYLHVQFPMKKSYYNELEFHSNLSQVLLFSLCKLKNLQELRLDGGCCKHWSSKSLQELFSSLKNLCHLSLEGCPAIDNNEMSALCTNSGKTLLTLKLANCREITDIALTILAQNCPNLVVFNINWAEDTYAGAFLLQLMNPVNFLPKLRLLDIRETAYFEHGLAMYDFIRSLRPHLIIRYLFPIKDSYIDEYLRLPSIIRGSYDVDKLVQNLVHEESSSNVYGL